MDIKFLTKINQVFYWLERNEIVAFDFIDNKEGFIFNNPKNKEMPFKLALQSHNKSVHDLKEYICDKTYVTSLFNSLNVNGKCKFCVIPGSRLEVAEREPSCIDVVLSKISDFIKKNK